MKKKVLFVTAFMMLFCVAKAQDALDTNAAPRFYHWNVGLSLGFDYNDHSANMVYMKGMTYTGLIGVTSGLHVQYNFMPWLGVRAGVMTVMKNYTMTNTVVLEGKVVGGAQTNTYNGYLDVPVMAVFSYGNRFKVHLGLGCYMGYWMVSSRSGVGIPLIGEKGEFDEDVKFNSTRDNRFDGGLAASAGISLALGKAQAWSLGLEGCYFYGLTDIQKKYMRNLSPRYNTTFAVQLSLSYSF
ncbi:MAG: PorT family protein [Bacteroidales bacterium]|nr:PorT family protein [Bacteroidales bacterium]MBQ6070107.1 PorT family protein [Bacteroidales bacterium]